uniref:ubiquitinyl hydrolase 1 n=1 Tax=Albugo laibachii Nc14 TaxID=890382 RepID=F0W9B1_9STRA|nr:ubiquitinspecific protease putative [Albugo laibachii Nc14]CCA18370.1 ubiquitinspecific protease putative [Albugo laibachii Nc14]|eukprot:CCA18370.1 ubiquitinspecific protease putative [Albugo laibachii Nc14]
MTFIFIARYFFLFNRQPQDAPFMEKRFKSDTAGEINKEQSALFYPSRKLINIVTRKPSLPIDKEFAPFTKADKAEKGDLQAPSSSPVVGSLSSSVSSPSSCDSSDFKSAPRRFTVTFMNSPPDSPSSQSTEHTDQVSEVSRNGFSDDAETKQNGLNASRTESFEHADDVDIVLQVPKVTQQTEETTSRERKLSTPMTSTNVIENSISSPSDSSLKNSSLEIESVFLPVHGIKEIEIEKNLHTVFTIDVKLQSGLQWKTQKRYSDFRELHDKLRRANANVRQLYFPKRHVFRNRHQSVVEHRRNELERYLKEVLDMRTQIRFPLYKFLEVYTHMETYERRVSRRKKEIESERMKNMLSGEVLEDFTQAFRRLCTSKYMYHESSSCSCTLTSFGEVGETKVETEKEESVATNRARASSLSTGTAIKTKMNGHRSGGSVCIVKDFSLDKTDIERPSMSPKLSISRSAFRRDILGVFPDMPSSFSMRLIKAMSDPQGSDIYMDEFLRTIAIAQCGLVDDKLKFVFQMCDLDHSAKIQSTGLTNFFVSLYGRHVLDKPLYRRIITDAFDHGRVRMTCEMFVQAIKSLEAAEIDFLLGWMETFVHILCEAASPQLLESQEEFNPIVQQKILSEETHFSTMEIAILQDAFNTYRISGGGDNVDLDALTNDFALDISESRFYRIFSSFGARATGSDIDIFSFVNALSIASRGTALEKARFAFTLFATHHASEPKNGDGSDSQDALMTRDDAFAMLRLDLAQSIPLEESIVSFLETKGVNIGDRNAFSSISRRDSTIVTSPLISATELGQFVDFIMETHGTERLSSESGNGKSTRELTLSIQELAAWSTSTNYEMVSLRLMRELVFVDLGLVPQNKEEELLIAKGCYRSFDPQNLIEDDQWYILSRKFFLAWSRYVGLQTQKDAKQDATGTRPAKIDNSDLLDNAQSPPVLKAKDQIHLGVDFEVIPEQLWNALKLWYSGGPELPCKVITLHSGKTVFDVWGDAKNRENDEGNVDEIDILEQEAGKAQVKDPERQEDTVLARRMRSGGSVGLCNLGNTCYMNSALQCLCNTQLLAEYFLSGMYLDDINRTSTLGLQGKLAQVYGKLAEDMWCAKQKSISPRHFKKTIGKFNDAFRGNDQQDAQELLAFLLSGLSEDLNRITEKPYVDQPDSDGRYDSDLADEWWRNHLRREVSIIVALFTGQYKSLLTCMDCGFKSARFEPFTFLQVPLPEPTHTTVTLVLVLSNGMQPTKISIRLEIAATVFDLKKEIVHLCTTELDVANVTESDIKISEYSGSMIISYKADSRRIGQIRSIDHLMAFQLEAVQPEIARAIKSKGSARGEQLFDSMRSFHENLAPGALVEVKIRTASEYFPGVILECYPRDKSILVSVHYRGYNEDALSVSLIHVRPRQPRLLCVPLISRKLHYSAVYFKNPFRPTPFGTSNLVRLCPERTTGMDLYQLVCKRMKRFLADWPSPSLWPPDDPRIQSCVSEIDDVFQRSQCGFLLRRVDMKGLTDSRSPWLKRSFGCTIPCTSRPIDLVEEEAIAVDWDLTMFQDRSNLERMKRMDDHGSIARNDAIDKGPVPLTRCLQDFTAEELIHEGYCSSCCKHLEMTKKLEIWRLPPVMVIHLKRFQYTQTYRRKLLSLVEFPIAELDLGPCVAPHVEFPERYPMKKDTEEPVNETEMNEEARLRAVNRSHRGYTNTNLDQSRCLETLYDLYGVVNHHGALGGGHYTAFAKNFRDEQWYYYDDERVRVVEESKIVSSAAYLLFYIRNDMKGVMVKDMYPQNTNTKITEEDIDRFVQGDTHRCSLM